MASKHHNNSGLHVNESTPIIDLINDSDASSPPSTTVAIKVEPSSSNAAVTQQWPADFYAIDIIDFFTACEKNPSTCTETIFHEYFPNTLYWHSIVNKNCLPWKKAPQKLHDNILRQSAQTMANGLYFRGVPVIMANTSSSLAPSFHSHYFYHFVIGSVTCML